MPYCFVKYFLTFFVNLFYFFCPNTKGRAQRALPLRLAILLDRLHLYGSVYRSCGSGSLIAHRGVTLHSAFHRSIARRGCCIASHPPPGTYGKKYEHDESDYHFHIEKLKKVLLVKFFDCLSSIPHGNPLPRPPVETEEPLQGSLRRSSRHIR